MMIDYAEHEADAMLHMPKYLQDVSGCDMRDVEALLSLHGDIKPTPVRLDLYLAALWESLSSYIDADCPTHLAPMRYVLTVEDSLTALLGILYTLLAVHASVKELSFSDEEMPALYIRAEAKEPQLVKSRLLHSLSRLDGVLRFKSCARVTLSADTTDKDITLALHFAPHHAEVGFAYSPHAAHIGCVLRASVRYLAESAAVHMTEE